MASPTTVVFLRFFIFYNNYSHSFIKCSRIKTTPCRTSAFAAIFNRLPRSLLWNRVNSVVHPLNSMSLIQPHWSSKVNCVNAPLPTVKTPVPPLTTRWHTSPPWRCTHLQMKTGQPLGRGYLRFAPPPASHFYQLTISTSFSSPTTWVSNIFGKTAKSRKKCLRDTSQITFTHLQLIIIPYRQCQHWGVES
jgi:hypothetical protein